MDTQKNAWLYCRVASPENSCNALFSQEERMRQLAEEMGYRVIGTTSEVANGHDFPRAGMSDMLNAADRGDFTVLLVPSYSRLGRGFSVTKAFIDHMNERGISTYIADQSAFHQGMENPFGIDNWVDNLLENQSM